MIGILRDWRYSVPLGALLAITIMAAVLAASPRHDATANPGPTTEGTATATMVIGTPSAGDLLLDARRKLDLAALRDAVEAYRFRFGTYPSTGDAYQGACAAAAEALCALKWISAKLPSGDGQTPYRYRSDGSTYVLYSPLSATDGPSGCPDEIPAEFAGGSVFCLTPAVGMP